jgi:hypothetical protein
LSEGSQHHLILCQRKLIIPFEAVGRGTGRPLGMVTPSTKKGATFMKYGICEEPKVTVKNTDSGSN